jgi:hypothetical protein
MKVILLFVLSGAVGWALSAVVLLAFLHVLGRAAANRMGLPYASKRGIDLASTLAPWPSAAEPDELAPRRELLQPGGERR